MYSYNLALIINFAYNFGSFQFSGVFSGGIIKFFFCDSVIWNWELCHT